jgi:hypothetical protein
MVVADKLDKVANRQTLGIPYTIKLNVENGFIGKNKFIFCC